jgi:glucokinase
MTHLLAVDIGGTKTLFRLSDEKGNVVSQQRLDSHAYDCFEDALTAFLSAEGSSELNIASAVFAVAGPVQGRHGSVTKLPWRLDADALSAQFNIGQVCLCNDFEAVGYGVACVDKTQLWTLHPGTPVETPNTLAVIGAGTGLGQAIVIPQADSWQVLPTEGGHVDFAPLNERQMAFLSYMQRQVGHVSYDRIVCGSGLKWMLDFLLEQDAYSASDALLAALEQADDPAAVMSEFAQEHDDTLCQAAFELFFDIYAAQVGNLGLLSFARGGIYLAGGIAAKNLSLLNKRRFVDIYVDKGRMQSLLAQIPVYIVLDPEVGLKGAEYLARKALYNAPHD